MPRPRAPLREQLEYEQLLKRALENPDDEEEDEALQVATALREGELEDEAEE